jgi:hypothetical protein
MRRSPWADATSWRPAGPASWVRPWWDRTLAPTHAASGRCGRRRASSRERRRREDLSTHEASEHKTGSIWHRRLRSCAPRGAPDGRRRRTWTHNLDRGFDRRVCMLLSFQRPSHRREKVVLFGVRPSDQADFGADNRV